MQKYRRYRSSKKEIYRNFYLLLFSFFTGVFLTYVLISTQKTTAIKDYNVSKLNKMILQKNPTRKKVVTWLRQHWLLYELTDSYLAKAITDLCPNYITSNFVEYQKHMDACISMPLVSYLRSAADNNEAPFQHAGLEVRIGIPTKINQPPSAFAYTCFEGYFENKTINIYSKNTKRSLTVKVKGAYHCNSLQNYPDVQLNNQQAHSLFQRKIRNIEYAVALVKTHL